MNKGMPSWSGKTSGCDAVIDQDAATHLTPTQYLQAKASGDRLQPNSAGLQAIAEAVDLQLFSEAAVHEAIATQLAPSGR